MRLIVDSTNINLNKSHMLNKITYFLGFMNIIGLNINVESIFFLPCAWFDISMLLS